MSPIPEVDIEEATSNKDPGLNAKLCRLRERLISQDLRYVIFKIENHKVSFVPHCAGLSGGRWDIGCLGTENSFCVEIVIRRLANGPNLLGLRVLGTLSLNP